MYTASEIKEIRSFSFWWGFGWGCVASVVTGLAWLAGLNALISG